MYCGSGACGLQFECHMVVQLPSIAAEALYAAEPWLVAVAGWSAEVVRVAEVGRGRERGQSAAAVRRWDPLLLQDGLDRRPLHRQCGDRRDPGNRPRLAVRHRAGFQTGGDHVDAEIG